MDYIPVYEGEEGPRPSGIPGRAAVRIPAEKRQLIGVKTGAAEKIRVVKEIRTAGRVAYDPELFTAQQEFLSAIPAYEKAKAGPYHEPPERAKALVEAARMRLRLKGMSEPEIEELEKRASQDQSLVLPDMSSPNALIGDPDSRFRGNGIPAVWVYAAVYEQDIPYIKKGTKAVVTVPVFQEKEFQGEVAGLDPVLDPATRSLRAQIRVADEGGLLRPEMFVDVTLKPDLGEVTAVPREAVMLTGERAIVFTVTADGYFMPKEVKLGAAGESYYEIKEGLEPGERVVVSGNFLIDSESRLQGALESMTAGGHQHGG